MGYYRFSDVERNLIVASTDMTGLLKKSFVDAPGQKLIRSHYSQTEFLSDIYGTNGVYADTLASSEDIKLDLAYVAYS
jgi:predicted metallopeptidase